MNAKKLLILCCDPRLYSCQRLKQAAEQNGYQLDILDPNRFLLQLQQER
ncbi:30S ribosomal protein S6--L-glutamate ligase, partial [Glaesserella parasuis]|nr:30S ribosomal protein S6--L-glutamate ligase [Glaesserella parasuis]